MIILLLLLMASSLMEGQSSGSHDFVLGRVETLQSGALKEGRVLNVYLPDGYVEGDTGRYPVIYLLDGSANEDYVHIVGLVQFMNMMGLMPEMVVVGIANVDRRRDFTFPTTVEQDKVDFPTTGGSGAFIQFLGDELIPFVEKHYRSNGTRVLIGQSLGGLLATEILLKRPELFSHYMIVSPSLWWDKESLLAGAEEVFAELPEGVKGVYISVGKEGKVMEGDARRLLKLLKGAKRPGLQVEFGYLPKEDHATILHRSIHIGFELLFGKSE